MAARDERTKRCVRSVRFTEQEIAEIEAEMKRQDRGFTWVVRRAWQISKPTIQSLPAVEEG